MSLRERLEAKKRARNESIPERRQDIPDAGEDRHTGSNGKTVSHPDSQDESISVPAGRKLSFKERIQARKRKQALEDQESSVDLSEERNEESNRPGASGTDILAHSDDEETQSRGISASEETGTDDRTSGSSPEKSEEEIFEPPKKLSWAEKIAARRKAKEILDEHYPESPTKSLQEHQPDPEEDSAKEQGTDDEEILSSEESGTDRDVGESGSSSTRRDSEQLQGEHEEDIQGDKEDSVDEKEGYFSRKLKEKFDNASDEMRDAIRNAPEVAKAEIDLGQGQTLVLNDMGLDMKDKYGQPIALNKKQLSGVELVGEGKSCVITGEAGTGKTTGQLGVVKNLIVNHPEKLRRVSYRTQDHTGNRANGVSIAVVSFTLKATANIRRSLMVDPICKEHMTASIMTIHNLLEFAPSEMWSEKQQKDVMTFLPRRDANNPLEITHLIMEEASLTGIPLWDQLLDALPAGCQMIFLGDINQLPPVFGKSILSYALLKLPVIYLDKVYRQALDNPIIKNAHRVLRGEMIQEELPALQWIKGKKGTGHKPQEQVFSALRTIFRKHHEEGKYKPEEDIILCPMNIEKHLMSTWNINYAIAQYLGDKREATVYEVIAGYNNKRFYLAVGDKVFFDKVEGIITNISLNMKYTGVDPRPASIGMTRFGMFDGSKLKPDDTFNYDSMNMDSFDMDMGMLSEDDLEAEDSGGRASSHIVDIELESGEHRTMTRAGDFAENVFQLGYALSVHKAQGSEWRKVYLILHKIHNKMMSRELLYTAITRAREELCIISREEQVKLAAENPRIKGDTLKEKIEFFNSGYLDEDVQVLP